MHDLAVKYDAHSHRKESVDGHRSTYITVTVPSDIFFQALMKGHVVVRAEQQTVGFRTPSTSELFSGSFVPKCIRRLIY